MEKLAAADEMWDQSHSALHGDALDQQLLKLRLQPLGIACSNRAQRLHGRIPWFVSCLARQHIRKCSTTRPYEIERLIGAGGKGVVFKAFDTDLNRPVAIKVLAPHLSGNGAARQRFAREARAAAAVVHEHIVAIHNVESNELSPFLVMQYVAGESLQERIDRSGPLKLCEILRIGMQTAAGLAAAHAQGLVHRDIKPPIYFWNKASSGPC